MNKLEFSCFTWIFKTRVEYGFLYNPAVEGTVTSIAKKIRVFWHIDVQEFHLCFVKLLNYVYAT